MLDRREIGFLIVDMGDAVKVNIIKYYFLIRFFEHGKNMIERPQCREDRGSGTGAGGGVVSRDDDRRDLRDTEPFELAEAKADGAVGRVGSVEEVARVDDVIGSGFQYRVDDLGKGVVEIGFALIDSLNIQYLKIVKPQMGVGEMEDSQRRP